MEPPSAMESGASSSADSSNVSLSSDASSAASSSPSSPTRDSNPDGPLIGNNAHDASPDPISASFISKELANADMTIAPDGTFIETTSGIAARELKRRYDNALGVGKNGKRSPYAIVVAIDNQGRTVFRLSSAASVISTPSVVGQQSGAATELSNGKRRLRMSVGGLFKDFKAGQAGQNIPSSGKQSTPIGGSSSKKPSKLVRNTRSVAELRPAVGNAHGRGALYSVSSSSRGYDPSLEVDLGSTQPNLEYDLFSSILGWSDVGGEGSSVSSSRQSSDQLPNIDSGDDDYPYATEFGVRSGTRIPNPFGEGVVYTAPSTPLDVPVKATTTSPRQLRYMQSFESGLTARADDADRRAENRPLRPSTRMTSTTHSSASPYPTEVFEVLQTYKGIPLANSLGAMLSETTYKLSTSLSAAPKDDPRFVIWGELPVAPPNQDEPSGIGEFGSITSSSYKKSLGSSSKRRRGSSVTDSGHSISGASSSAAGVSPLPPQKAIVAATIERWIAQLTSELNYIELLDFFLTYRVYIRAIDLCQLLICRFHWALEGPIVDESDTSGATKNKYSQEEIVKKIVRVRTFIALRYWLTTFFQVDFLKDRELCLLLTGWLNSLKADTSIVKKNADVLDIVRKLKKVVRECKSKWSRDDRSSAASTTDSSDTRYDGPGGLESGTINIDNQDADVDLDLGPDPPSPRSELINTSLKGLPTAGSVSSHMPSIPYRSATTNGEVNMVFTGRPSDVSAAPSAMSHYTTSTVTASGAGTNAGLGATSPIHPSAPGSLGTNISPLHMTILAHAKVGQPGPGGVGSGTMAMTPVLPPMMQHSTMSRMFVNAVGKLGRWKRVLHSRSSAGGAIIGGGLNPPCADANAFDLDDVDGGSGSDREGVMNARGALVGRSGAAARGYTDEYLRILHGAPPGSGTVNRPGVAGGSGLSAISYQSDEGTQQLPPGYSLSEAERAFLEGEGIGQGVQGNRTLVRQVSAIPLTKRASELVAAANAREALARKPSNLAQSHTEPVLDIAPDDNQSLDLADGMSPISPPGLDIPPHLLSGSAREAASTDVGTSGPAEELSNIEEANVVNLEDQPEDAPVVRQEGPSQDEKVEVDLSDDEDQINPSEDVTMHAPSVPPPSEFVVTDDSGHAQAAPNFDNYSINSEATDEDDRRFHRRPEIVSLDDFDLSESESSDGGDFAGAGRLKRAQRRLPNRRDFQFVRTDSASSMGIRSSYGHSSVASSSVASSISGVSESEGGAQPTLDTGEIKDWQVALITDSDDDEPGDAEAALRRLEGQIDTNRQRANERKVDRWMRTVARRLAAGDTSLNFDDLDEEDEEEGHQEQGDRRASEVVTASGESSPGLSASNLEADKGGSRTEDESTDSVSGERSQNGDDVPRSPIQAPVEVQIHLEGESTSLEDAIHAEREALGAVTPTPPSIPGELDDNMLPRTPTFAKPSIESLGNTPGPRTETTTDTAALDDLKASRRRGYNTSSLARKATYLKTLSMRPPTSGRIGGVVKGSVLPAIHHSFILLHRTMAIVEQFAMIERELFLGIKFDEIVSGKWALHEEKGDVLDWAAYLKDKARVKTAARSKGEEADLSEVSAIRARFNLMAAWAASEVVLTHPSQRVAVFSQFIRIAFKAYRQNIFNVVVAIVTGLQSQPVKLAMRRLESRIGLFEMRCFEDLAVFTSPRNNFRYIRDAIAALDSPPESGVPTSAPSKGKQPEVKKSCVPFIGIYLSQLQKYRKLPDYIDPTSPTSPVLIDKTTGMLSPPLHPEVFSTLQTLPPSVPLEPLINVQKQRLTAGVVKEIVAGQHLASNVSYEPDRKLYQKCLRLKALPVETQTEIANLYEA
ncbi:hypothetical protein FRC02_000973 [Tulasnella sp. 418]|nr:hypothetical protein FRC02_000973 [Tulasnella sp. 418]